MKTQLRNALVTGALVLGLAGVAGAAVTDAGMHGMSGGGMMSAMMGDDPVAMCSSMMKRIAADPKRHREMNAMMKSQMGSTPGVTTAKAPATPASRTTPAS
ncbi:MAG: hypothetical protein NVSMB21_12330 [Vulcanimicrobiaceae bacterium]